MGALPEKRIPRRNRGGQPGNRNAVKHGFTTAGAKRERREFRAFLSWWRRMHSYAPFEKSRPVTAARSLEHGNTALLTAPLLGGRVLEFRPEGRAWRLSVTQVDGKDRRQAGGFDVTAAEWPHFTAVVQALGAAQTAPQLVTGVMADLGSHQHDWPCLPVP
jgi:hypothetical protein